MQYNGDHTAAKYFYLRDRLGNVRQLIDTSANVVNYYTFGPFGELLTAETAENTENPFKYTGQFYDSEIGQYYLRARQYDPQLMRLTGRDPVKGRFLKPMSLHKYLYCENEPTDFVDPSGCSLYSQLNAIQEGADIYNEALLATAYGVTTDDWRFIQLGILMQQMISPAMDIVRLIQYRTAQLEAARNALAGIASAVESEGITLEEAHTMMDWADEYNVSRSRGLEQHLGRNYNSWHIRIGSHHHITVNVPENWVYEGPYRCK